MKKKRFRAALAVALVAAAGVEAYETYQDYKADKESTLVMQNVEALTTADVNGISYFLWKNRHTLKNPGITHYDANTDSVAGVCYSSFVQSEDAEKKAKSQGYVYTFCHSHDYRICKMNIPLL